MASTHHLHFVLFPFMSKGHTIPLLHLAELLLPRGVKLTFFTTKANRSFIAQFLHRHSETVSIVDLLFPTHIEGIPQGIESTDKLPSMSLLGQFATATKLMQPHFEQALEKIPDVTCIVSDGFLSWTLASANKFGIPRLSFFPISGYVSALIQQVVKSPLLSGPEADDDLITVTRFPWIQVTRNEFFEPLNRRNPTGPQNDFFMESITTMANSYGEIMNSFYELEPLFLDYLNRDCKRKVLCVGPFSLGVTESPPKVDPSAHQDSDSKPKWVVWLDQKQAEGCSVLYIAFGSQAEISPKQLEAISNGLEESQVNFLWVVRNCETSVVDEIQERVGERGLIVRDWVDQWEILKHESVKGFVSHCGWNSVLESISAGVPILAWPMTAEQPLNARMVVEEIKVGLRVETCDGSVRGFVKSEGLKKMVKELMEGDNGKQVRKKVQEVAKAAKDAMAEDGSSWRTLDRLLDEVRAFRNIDTET